MAEVTPDGFTEEVVAIATAVFGWPARARDNFYDLGGDSFKAVEFAARLEERVGREVTAALVTAAPDLGTLAEELRTSG